MFYWIITLVFILNESIASAVAAEPVIPAEQLQFEEKRANFSASYSAASNQIQQSSIFNEDSRFTRKFFKERGFAVKDWVGVISSIQTDHGGNHAFLFITCQYGDYKITFQTFRLVDLDTDSTAIKKGTSVYRELGNLVEGDKVIFSAKLFPDSDKGIRELSVTEEGSVTEPEFSVRFKDVRKAN